MLLGSYLIFYGGLGGGGGGVRISARLQLPRVLICPMGLEVRAHSTRVFAHDSLLLLYGISFAPAGR